MAFFCWKAPTCRRPATHGVDAGTPDGRHLHWAANTCDHHLAAALRAAQRATGLEPRTTQLEDTHQPPDPLLHPTGTDDQPRLF